jgi:chaperonin GroES
MMDAGHLANIQGGFVSSALGVREKTVKLKMGEWKVLNTAGDLRAAVMPITYPGPSETLFKLLGLLVEMGKEVASIKDVLSGEVKSNMQPTTVLALIDQGMQFFTAIYKRIHRTIKDELAIHGRLNLENLSPEDYNAYFDDPEQQFDPKADFASADQDVTPVSDPQASTKMQKLAKAQFIKEWATENPRANQEEVDRRLLEAADVEDIDKLFAQPPPPDPLMTMLGELEAQGKMADITQKMTAALKNVADAEAAEAGQQLDYYAQFMSALQQEFDNGVTLATAGQGGLPGMEGQSNDQAGAGAAPSPSDGAGTAGQGLPVPSGPPPGPAGANVAVPPA